MAAAALLACSAAAAASAQCPDGSPPPCRGAVVARTAAPALNPKAWIVAPFTNVTRTTELEWLRDAAVNLMSLDMERWTDLSVVPDKRVSDLLRETLGARAAQPIGLKDGLALARRAGAGMLVMGDFIKVGRGARLVANVFDVRTGARVRTVSQQTAVLDSLIGVFGPLTRGVLALPPPGDAAVGDVGTGRVDAYQAYLRGVQARNRMELIEAEARFREALALDSTFALAHAELANVLHKGRFSDLVPDNERIMHAIAAERLGGKLPPRARALVSASAAFARRDLPAMCAAADPLVAADSTDVEAIYAAMSCRQRDAIIFLAEDSSFRFRGDANVVLRLARRSLRVDPAFYPAFDMLAQVLLTEARYGCPERSSCPRFFFRGLLILDGDTVDTRHAADSLGNERRTDRFDEQAKAFRQRLLALRYVDEWIASAPTNPRAHQARAEILFQVGRSEEAWGELHSFPIPANKLNVRALNVALEIAVGTGRGAEARAWHDSLQKASAGDSIAMLATAMADLWFGRAAGWRRWRTQPSLAAEEIGAVPAVVRRTALPAEVVRTVQELDLRVVSKVAAPGRAAAESLVAFAEAPKCNAACRALMINNLVLEPTPWLPDSIVRRLGPLARAIARGDTASARRLGMSFDRSGRRGSTFNGGDLLLAARAYLLVADSMSALRALRYGIDSSATHELLARRNGTFATPYHRVHAMILRGELAAALGYPEEAAKWLDRVIDLWADSEPDWQAEVTRLRAIRARLNAPTRP
jgi:tetratricopeptide (TPR) repeat protein/TolB-like protein